MNIFDRIVFNSEGGGGGGGDAGSGAAPAASSSAPASPPAGSGGASAPAPSASGEPPAGASPPASAGSPYKPDGLPDHMLGQSDQQTIDNMKKALDGYRTRDAEANIPSDPKAYAEFTSEIPAPIKPHIEKLTGDPLYDRVAAKAAELKLSVPQYQGLVMEMMSASSEMGILEPPIDIEAEKAALVPDTAKHLSAAEQTAAREKRMTENFAYVDQMVALGKEKGGLSKEAGDYAKAMLGDTARGHEFIEFLRSRGAGGHKGPAIPPAVPAANDARADLARRAALPENTLGHPAYSRASHDALMADYQRLIPD